MLRRLTPPSNLPDIECWNIVRGAACLLRDAALRPVWEDESSSLSILDDPDSDEEPTFVVSFDEVADFILSNASHEVLVSPLDDDVADNTLDHLLLDQIWPRILAQGGQLVLHAAGVAGPNGAILFVGQSGRGKSTLAASLHQRGFALLGDDAMVMSAGNGETRCSAVYRSLRLFPDSIATLFDGPVHRSEVADYTDKENVHLALSEEPDGDHRVQAIFFISPDDSAAGASVERVAPSDACVRLVEHSFWLDPTDMALAARKFHSASALADDVPVFQLAYPRDYAKLADLHAAIFSVLD